MDRVWICHLTEGNAFASFCREFENAHPLLRFGHLEVRDTETELRSDLGGMKVLWVHEGEGEVFLPRGFRSKEGDGHPLPPEYAPEPIEPEFDEALTLIEEHVDDFAAPAKVPVQAILERRRNRVYMGDYANDLWKLDHARDKWSDDPAVMDAIYFLFRAYRRQGYSVKTVDSFERIMEGDQLIVAGRETLRVRGRFSCLTLEKMNRTTSHIPAVMRLRFLRDSSGGCNFDFDPFRRLPLTWYMKLEGETGDGLNFVNSHVVNIAKETSPTHFHPPRAIGGGLPQNEIYLVLNPKTYGLNTYGRKAALVVYPDLRNLHRAEEYKLEPGAFVFIPPGIGHRGIDVFVNVITIPGFKPHNEYYIDKDIFDTTQGEAPHNPNLFSIRNYVNIADYL